MGIHFKDLYEFAQKKGAGLYQLGDGNRPGVLVWSNLKWVDVQMADPQGHGGLTTYCSIEFDDVNGRLTARVIPYTVPGTPDYRQSIIYDANCAIDGKTALPWHEKCPSGGAVKEVLRDTLYPFVEDQKTPVLSRKSAVNKLADILDRMLSVIPISALGEPSEEGLYYYPETFANQEWTKMVQEATDLCYGNIVDSHGHPSMLSQIQMSKLGFDVYPGDSDSFGWMTGCIEKGNRVLVFG